MEVFFQVTGEQVQGERSQDTLAMLNAVAHALSNVVPIYFVDVALIFTPLNPIDLLGGTFDRGAMIFRTKDGREFQPLTIQRADMILAISVLKAAKATFRGAPLPGE